MKVLYEGMYRGYSTEYCTEHVLYGAPYVRTSVRPYSVSVCTVHVLNIVRVVLIPPEGQRSDPFPLIFIYRPSRPFRFSFSCHSVHPNPTEARPQRLR
jgi:hypothetical protein